METSLKRRKSNFQNGFVVIKKKKTFNDDAEDNLPLLRQNYSRLQEKLKITQSQLESATQEKKKLQDTYNILSQGYQTLQRNNMKLKSLNETSLKLLFQSCQNEEQLDDLRPLIESDMSIKYENHPKQNMVHLINQTPETQQSEVIKALEVIEKY